MIMQPTLRGRKKQHFLKNMPLQKFVIFFYMNFAQNNRMQGTVDRRIFAFVI